MMPQSDQLLESVYDVVNKQDGERMRCEVARIALLAAQFRAQQLHQQRMAKAIVGHSARAHSQAQGRLSLDPEPGQSERNTQ